MNKNYNIISFSFILFINLNNYDFYKKKNDNVIYLLKKHKRVTNERYFNKI